MKTCIRFGQSQKTGPQGFFLDRFRKQAQRIPLDSAPPNGTWIEAEIEGESAHLKKVLAKAHSARASVLDLAAGRSLDPVHPPSCLEEAEAWARDPGIDDPQLADLRALPFVTIDNPDSRDLDQAVFVERLAAGYKVWYALADASYYVRPESALFEEALRRGTSFYLPGFSVPMLPRILSEGIISLNPQVDRRALVFAVSVGPEGRMGEIEVQRGRIHSRAKLSYQGVQDWYDGGPEPTPDPACLESLRALAEVGLKRMDEAASRDVIRHHRVETEVSLGDEGLSFVTASQARNDVERFNEQISLLVNIAGAILLARAQEDPEVQPVYRTHEPPQEVLLERFATKTRELARLHQLDKSVWTWSPRSKESLSHFLRRLSERSDHPGPRAVLQRQALFTSGPSGFSAFPQSHYGVGAEVYARFTAPMREIVGIFVHKELTEALGMVEPEDPDSDDELRREVIQISSRARQEQRSLDREGNRLVLDRIFQADRESPEAPWRRGRILGLGRAKVHVSLEDPSMDVKVYAFDLKAIQGRKFQVQSKRQRVLAEGETYARVGDFVSIQVHGLDPERDRWMFDLRPEPEPEPEPESSPRPTP